MVDLGGEMGSGEVMPAVARHMRHASLPLSPTRAEYDNSKHFRHGSLPPKLSKRISASPVDDSIEEMDDEMDVTYDSESARETEPMPQNSKTLRAQVRPANVS